MSDKTIEIIFVVTVIFVAVFLIILRVRKKIRAIREKRGGCGLECGCSDKIDFWKNIK